MFNLLPLPKACETGGSCVLRPAYSCEPDLFPNALRTFADYADRAFGVSFTRGTGGLLLEADESLPEGGYAIEGAPGSVRIRARDENAMQYALATVLNALHPTGFASYPLALPGMKLTDAPDCPWRGLMIDLARKWHPVKYLYDAVDFCWLYKLSRLQLHFTDDQSYTLPSKAFPKLPGENRHYTEAELRALAEYAGQRGVTLVPEIDMPGHCSRFCETYPEVFGSHGILCSEEKTYEALETLIREAEALFPDAPYLHLGGDEAAIARWDECEGCRAYREAHGIADVHELYARFLARVTDFVLAEGRTPVIWEGFSKEYNHLISKDVLVVAWESYYQPAPSLSEAGFTLLNCSWKPLYIVTPDTHWSFREILEWNPWVWRHWWEKSEASRRDITLPESAPVLGGQMCAWGDRLCGYPSNEQACREEFALIRALVPALAEKTWNVHSALEKDRGVELADGMDALLTKLLRS